MTIFLNTKIEFGKKAGHTGLTQANDAETTCNNRAEAYCEEVTSGWGPMFCFEAEKYDSTKTPPCHLYTNEEYICNTAASAYCDEVTADQGGRAPAMCYLAEKFDSTKTPPCPVYTNVEYICNTAASAYCDEVRTKVAVRRRCVIWLRNMTKKRIFAQYILMSSIFAILRLRNFVRMMFFCIVTIFKNMTKKRIFAQYSQNASVQTLATMCMIQISLVRSLQVAALEKPPSFKTVNIFAYKENPGR